MWRISAFRFAELHFVYVLFGTSFWYTMILMLLELKLNVHESGVLWGVCYCDMYAGSINGGFSLNLSGDSYVYSTAQSNLSFLVDLPSELGSIFFNIRKYLRGKLAV